MKQIARLLQLLYFGYAALVFLVLLVPVFLFALAATSAGTIRGGNLIYEACKVWADLWYFFVGIRHRNIFEQPLEKDKSYIFVANHISYLDAGLFPKVFRKPLRTLARAETNKVPVFGLVYRYVTVSVDRSSATHRARSVLRLRSVLRKGISVLVFPEGTFNETHRPLATFYDGAFRIAIESGAPIKPVLLLDTYDRFPYDKSFALTPGISRAVFLEEVPVTGLTLADAGRLKEQVYRMMEEKLIAYKASWIQSP